MAELKNYDDFICFNCKNYNEPDGNCKAFPIGIPYGMGVLFMHNDPLPEQKNNIVFERGEPTI
jgi:hypothetical protein